MTTNTENIRIPAHVGIIMDGNGRWAKKRGLPRNLGHRQGAENLGKIVKHAAKRGVRVMTVYAFSTENWKRPADEVEGIMDLLRNYLADMERYKKENVRTKIIGDRTRLAPDLQESIRDLERRSMKNDGLLLNIALNYGGRDEIIMAAKALAKDYLTGTVKDIDHLGEDGFGSYLYTAGQPDVDLVIRTSGEQRISNFLLWQSAYAEYIFTDVLWPDFSPKQFDEALEQFNRRDRRMGASE